MSDRWKTTLDLRIMYSLPNNVYSAQEGSTIILELVENGWGWYHRTSSPPSNRLRFHWKPDETKRGRQGLPAVATRSPAVASCFVHQRDIKWIFPHSKLLFKMLAAYCNSVYQSYGRSSRLRAGTRFLDALRAVSGDSRRPRRRWNSRKLREMRAKVIY